MLERGSSEAGRPAVVRLLPARQDRVPETGAVQSVQEAEVLLPRAVLERLWRPEYLERLARSYWRFLRRITLGLVRVVYEPDSRTIVLLSRRLPLLRFAAPEYETSADRGCVTWPIERGLLVAKEGRGKGLLRICVERLQEEREPAETAQAAWSEPADSPPTEPEPATPQRAAKLGPTDSRPAGEQLATVHVRLDVRSFYPWLRGSGRFARFGTWLYSQTQLRIHVLVCNAFLRSLARLDLPPPSVGGLRGEIDAGASG
jgi:hypothetical protein